MPLKYKRNLAEMAAKVEALEAEVAGEKAKGVLLQKRAEKAEAKAEAAHARAVELEDALTPAQRKKLGL